MTARRGQELTAILPGFVRRGPFGLHTFAFLGTEYESSDYLEVIQRPEETSPMLPRMLDYLVAHAGSVDVLHVSNVLSSRSILGDLQHYAESSGASHYVNVFKTCPFLLTEGMSWESYVAQLSPKMRKNLRRSTRQLIDAGAEFTLVRERARVRPGIAELFDLHARRFASKHEPTGFSAKTRGPFHADVSECLFDADILRLFLLRLDGRTVAALYCFEFGDTLFFFQSGFDPGADKLSAGTVLVGYAINYAIDNGLACFDFMRGEEAYKFRWTSKTRQMFTARLGLTYRGRLYLAQEALISRAKKVIKSAAAARFRPVSTQQAEAS